MTQAEYPNSLEAARIIFPDSEIIGRCDRTGYSLVNCALLSRLLDSAREEGLEGGGVTMTDTVTGVRQRIDSGGSHERIQPLGRKEAIETPYPANATYPAHATYPVQHGSGPGDFYEQKGALLRLRAKLSNSFHKCKSDSERAAVSKQIADLHGQLRALHEPPAPLKAPKPIIPEDGAARLRKLQSVRASISRFKRQIKGLIPQKNELAKEQIASKQAKIDILLKQKILLEDATK